MAIGIDLQRAAMEEIGRLIKSVRQGRLADRANLPLAAGDFKEVLANINELLDVILLPIGEGNRILDQVAHGKVNELITETYQGDHEKMKQNVNSIALVLQRFQAELTKLLDYSQKGQLEKRGEAAGFKVAMPTSSRASTRCSMPSCCRSARAIASSTKVASGKVDELISQDLPRRPREDEAERQRHRADHAAVPGRAVQADRLQQAGPA